jgi:hypothetical protein
MLDPPTNLQREASRVRVISCLKTSMLQSKNLRPVNFKMPPLDDFNTRIVLFGRDYSQARAIADLFSKRPWHNVSYFPGPFETLASAVRSK